MIVNNKMDNIESLFVEAYYFFMKNKRQLMNAKINEKLIMHG